MNHLQYTSKEMFSSTELIRKSKMIFEKVSSNQIEKAIILRDGKPSFMLLDFAKYEEIMTEYLELKQMKEQGNKKVQIEEEEVEIKIEKSSLETSKSKEEINELDLEEALAKIESLNLDFQEKKESVIEEKKTTEKEPLKDFWD